MILQVDRAVTKVTRIVTDKAEATGVTVTGKAEATVVIETVTGKAAATGVIETVTGKAAATKAVTGVTKTVTGRAVATRAVVTRAVDTRAVDTRAAVVTGVTEIVTNKAAAVVTKGATDREATSKGEEATKGAIIVSVSTCGTILVCNMMVLINFAYCANIPIGDISEPMYSSTCHKRTWPVRSQSVPSWPMSQPRRSLLA